MIKNNDLIRISGKNAVQVIVQFIVGLLKIKITSIWLGPSGMALFSQYLNFIQMASNLSGAGITGGTTKLLSAYSISPSRQKLVLSTSFIITTIFSSLTAIFTFIFASFLSQKLLHSLEYVFIFKLSGIFFFFLAITNLTLAILKGQKRYTTFIYYSLLIVIVSILLLFPFVIVWGIKGAIWALLISYSITGIISIWIIKPPRLKSILFHKSIAKRLFGFSLMIFIPIIISPFIQIVIRDIIIQHCSLIEAGWWDGINRISFTYTSIIFTSLSLYYQPRISELNGFSNIKKEVYNSIKIILPFVIMGSVLIYLSRHLTIKMLFSQEFYGMHKLFFFQCIGDILKVSSWFLGTAIIIKENHKSYIICELILALFRPSIAFMIIPTFGIEGSTLCYLISNIFYLIIISVSFINNGKRLWIKPI